MLPVLVNVFYLLVFGLAVGFIGALFGVGGGFILVPLLTFIFNVDAHSAIGTSLAAIMFTGFSSATAYFRQGRIDWKLALAMETSTMPGALTGAFLTTYFPSKTLKVFLAALLLFLAVSMILKKESTNPISNRAEENSGKLCWDRVVTDSRGEKFAYRINVPKMILTGMMAGLASGFFGIGGGVIKVPALYHLGVPMHVAVATSTLMITLTAFSGTIGHALLGHVLWQDLLGIVPGIILGTQLGAKISRRTKSKNLRIGFSLILALMAILLIVR